MHDSTKIIFETRLKAVLTLIVDSSSNYYQKDGGTAYNQLRISVCHEHFKPDQSLQQSIIHN